MALLRTEDRDGVRIVVLANPPVNALSFALSAELCAALDAAEADAGVRAIVITGAGGLFSGGADINDFEREPAPGSITVRDANARIERSGKTFVAAIERTALGGGLELALACDYRIATPGTRVGLPEIKLGLLPGAGGTQRLPRLLGAQAALEVMLKGDPLSAEDAQAKGILDEIVSGDLLAAAIVRSSGPKRRISDRTTALGIAGMGLFAAPFALAQAHKMVPPEDRGGFAAHKLVDAVDAALELDFQRGLAREARLFDELVRSPQSAALRHLFFAERELGKIPGLPDVAPLPIATAGILGAGTMGTGIAITFAEAGIPTVVIEPNDEQIERAKQMVFGMFANNVQRGRLTQEEAWKRGQSIRFESEIEELADVDIVIEAVFENLDVKLEAFPKLDAICKPSAILASNTSTLDIDAMAAATKRPEQVLGLHFFAPANIMKLLEIIRGKGTSPQTLATGIALAKKLRKVGVVSGNAFGFIGNRMLFEYEREAAGLAEEGVSPGRIDRVMKEVFGFAMGPFAVADLSGLDVYHRIEQSVGAPFSRVPLIATLVERGWLGQKSGHGFFRYDPAVGRGREPIPDPEVEALIAALAREAGIAQRPDVADDEIIRRCVTALIDTGAELLRTGIALRPGDVDLAWIYGYGFPPYRGGPMWYATERGYVPGAKVLSRA
jgi:3-hydroxyacyl-CoA dehydrogenase